MPGELISSGILLSGGAYSSREHAVLGSRRVDGQARAGSGRVNGRSQVNRTSPEPSTLLAKVLGFFLLWGSARASRAGEDAPSRSRTFSGTTNHNGRNSPCTSSLLRSARLFLRVSRSFTSNPNNRGLSPDPSTFTIINCPKSPPYASAYSAKPFAFAYVSS